MRSIHSKHSPAAVIALGGCILGLANLAGCGSSPHGTLPPHDDGGTGDGHIYAAWPNAVYSGGTIDARSCTPTTPAAPGPVGIAPRCASPDKTAPIALGVCGDLAADNTVTLDSRPGPDGAVLAVSGRSRTASPLHVGGSFSTFLGNEANNTQDVDGDLRTNGDWTSSAPAHIGRDAFVGALFTPKNTVSIGGTLHVAQIATPSVPDGVTAGDVVSGGPVTVAPPLDCARAPDVRALAASGAPEYTVARDALVRIVNPTRIILGCNRYRFASIQADNELSIRVEGNVVVVVDGDFRIASPTRFDLAPGATLDLIVGGSLSVDNTLAIGGGPAWVGVGGRVRVAAPMTLEGWLVAPTATVDLDNTLDLAGGALVGPLRVASPLHVRPGVAVASNGCALR